MSINETKIIYDENNLIDITETTIEYTLDVNVDELPNHEANLSSFMADFL
jgi:hypothetical protein